MISPPGSSALRVLRRRLDDVDQGGAVIRVASEGELEAQLATCDASAAALPLAGQPFAVKDNIDIAGVVTTAACPAFARVATSSATAVRKLQAAGAAWVAKTNLDQFATGLVGTRSPYGAPASVHAADRISGGSSSGSAVLVARGDVPFALGTDTAGSGRVPAGFNGIVGLKPTPGRVSTAGVVPACRSLDCVSIFARTVDDAATVLAVVEGADDADPYSAFVAGPAWFPTHLRVAVPGAPVFTGDAGYAGAWAEAVGALSALEGVARVQAIDLCVLDEIAALLYAGPWLAERHAVIEQLLGEHPDAIDPIVRAVIEPARTMSATDAFRGAYRLRALARAAESVFHDADVLMVPTASGHPTFAEVAADPIASNAELGRYTNFVNLLGWCAIAVPAGRTARGLPFGVTFIAPAHHDAALVDLARRWERERRGAEPADRALPTVLEPASEPTLALAVVGAHLSGLPLNGQLVERGAVREACTRTAPHYRLHALPGTTPAKPGLVRVPAHGTSIEVEVWRMPQGQVGSFLALVPPPLGLGSIELVDGVVVHGFLCEAHAAADAPDVSRFGGWRAYLSSRS